MNGIDAVADTNVLIYLFNGNEDAAFFLKGINPVVSVITELELISGKHLAHDEEFHIREFLHECEIVDILPDIKGRVQAIRRQYKLKLPDSIIISTAIELDIPFLTADKAFSKVKYPYTYIFEP